MTETANNAEQGLLWRQEHLAPLPIPTGQPASDVMNIIWRKNPVFIDIGSFAMGAGWLTLHCLTFITIVASIWVASSLSGIHGINWLDFWGVPIVGSVILCPLWYLFIKQWRKPLTPAIRFNRQRREVCITKPDGQYWFVPWEKVHAIAPSAISLNTGGASKHGSLILWFPLKGQLHETYAPNKKGWVLMVNPGGGISSMAQWECIRSFMEVGPDAVPDSSHPERGDKIEREGYFGMWRDYTCQLFDELKAREYADACSTIAGLTIFGAPWVAVLMTKKLAHIPDLTAPEVIEWSKAIPQEQWAKRSPELEIAIAEREAELAGQHTQAT